MSGDIMDMNHAEPSYTPICDFVKSYSQSGALRLHMPGHKGRALIGAESLDITEIEGADVLYHAEGIIRESEDNALRLFGRRGRSTPPKAPHFA